MNKKKIALVAGGDSGEYQISINSAASVAQSIDRNLFEVFLVHIKGFAWHCQIEGKNIPVDKNDFSIQWDGQKIKFDCIFNMVHGTPGENGLLTGYFEMLGIAQTTGSAANLALTFNKHYCKQFLLSSGIDMAPSVFLLKDEAYNTKDIVEKLGLPIFVKPNNGGSSVGMSKVTLEAELAPAIETAFKEDDQVLVERFISGRELSCGVFRRNNEVIALPVTEIISKNEFFDFEAKYDKRLHEEITPAPVPEEVFKECQQVSAHVYRLLNCAGVVRVDYIWDNNKLNFLEINTIPGMSSASIVPQQARAANYTDTSFYTELLLEATGS